MAQPDQREHLRHLIEYCEHNREWLRYPVSPSRPMSSHGLYEADLCHRVENKIRTVLDCSDWVTWICKMSGLKDPSGENYSGIGNSGTMFNHLSHFSDPMKTLTGTLVVFGPNGGNHVAIVYQGRIADPMVGTHGTDTGPAIIPLSYFAKEYAEHTFLSIGVL